MYVLLAKGTRLCTCKCVHAVCSGDGGAGAVTAGDSDRREQRAESREGGECLFVPASGAGEART